MYYHEQQILFAATLKDIPMVDNTIVYVNLHIWGRYVHLANTIVNAIN